MKYFQISTQLFKSIINPPKTSEEKTCIRVNILLTISPLGQLSQGGGNGIRTDPLQGRPTGRPSGKGRPMAWNGGSPTHSKNYVHTKPNEWVGETKRTAVRAFANWWKARTDGSASSYELLPMLRRRHSGHLLTKYCAAAEHTHLAMIEKNI